MSTTAEKTKNITGNTYPVKDKLKAIGCRWNSAAKCWTATGEKMIAEADQIMSGQPTYNSPPPQDLGPIDIAAECAKYKRVPIGTETVPFRLATSKGADGTGELLWGKSKGVRNRYLVLRTGRATYLSRSWLEDMDLFHLDPGYYCDVQGVAVEPTPEEIASDPAVTKAKEEGKKKRRNEIERLVQQGHSSAGKQDPRSFHADLTGLTKVWGNKVYTLYTDGISRLVFCESSSDDWAAWEHIDAALVAEALTLVAS